MELRPADLGDAFATPFVVSRAQGQFDYFTVLWFRLFYRRGSGFARQSLDSVLRQITAAILPTRMRTLGSVIGVLTACLLMLVIQIVPYRSYIEAGGDYGFLVERLLWFAVVHISLTITLTSVLFGYQLQKKFIAPLTHQEAYAFYQAQTDPTSRIYGHLVCDLVQAPDIVPAAIPALRDAVRLFGEAVHGLSTKKFAIGDAAALRRRAANARERAFSETDPVLKAALVQEADAHEDAAVSAIRNGLMTKRVAGLQDALVAQMKALRLELPAFQASNTDMTHLLTLSEKVRTVTAQAGAITSAHAELDALPDATPTYAARMTPVWQSVGDKHQGGL